MVSPLTGLHKYFNDVEEDINLNCLIACLKENIAVSIKSRETDRMQTADCELLIKCKQYMNESKFQNIQEKKIMWP